MIKHRILTLIQSLYGGGAEKVAADLSFNLNELFQSTILLYEKNEEKYPYKGKLEELNIASQNGIFNKLVRQREIIKQIKKFKNSYKPKVSISHMGMSNIHNVLSKDQEKTICVLHGDVCYNYKNSKVINKILRNIYAKSDYIVSVSHYLKADFEKIHQIKTPHIVIYNGINIQEVQTKSEDRISLSLPERFIVYVSAFRAEKNHLKLLEQIKPLLDRTEICLVLVGDGHLRKQIEEKIQQLELTHKVLLTGNLANPYPVLKKALLSILVSETESFSLVVVESLALGVPVIATDCGGPKEILESNITKEISLPFMAESGILIDKVSDWKKGTLTNEIELLMADDNLRASMSKKGVERAKFFDIKETSKKYVALITNLM